MQKIGFATLAAGLLTLTGSTTAWAQDDTIRLGTSASGTVTDIELVYGRGGYHHAHWGGAYGRGYGYNRSYWGGGYGRGYWGGYRYAYAGYRPYYYRPAYYRPFLYVNYYQPYYVPAPVYYYPISGQADVQGTYAQAPAQTQSPAPYQTTTAKPQLLPLPATAPQQPAGPQTFPYDGGPQSPLPMPQVDPASGPRLIIPLKGKVVSLPRETTLGSTQHLMVSLNSSPQPTASSAPNAFSYQAYGEQPLPAVRKQAK